MSQQQSFDRAQRAYDAQYEAPRGRLTRGRPTGGPLTVEQARRLAKFHDYSISKEFKPGHLSDELKALR